MLMLMSLRMTIACTVHDNMYSYAGQYSPIQILLLIYNYCINLIRLTYITRTAAVVWVDVPFPFST